MTMDYATIDLTSCVVHRVANLSPWSQKREFENPEAAPSFMRCCLLMQHILRRDRPGGCCGDSGHDRCWWSWWLRRGLSQEMIDCGDEESRSGAVSWLLQVRTAVGLGSLWCLIVLAVLVIPA